MGAKTFQQVAQDCRDFIYRTSPAHAHACQQDRAAGDGGSYPHCEACRLVIAFDGARDGS